MQNEIKTITNLKNYLLANLSPAELEATDLQVISGEISEENLFGAESELMEDYLDERLSPAEIKLFNENFLVSPDRRAEFKQLSLLRNYARKKLAQETLPTVSETAPEGFFSKLKSVFSLNTHPALAAFALLLIALVIVFYFVANRQTTSEREYAALNQKDLSDLNETKSMTAVNLMSGVFRDSGSSTRLAENRLTEKVFFRLGLPVSSNAPDKFRAEVIKDGAVVFTLDQLPFYNNPNGQEIRLLLPSTVLKKGTYQIKLTKTAAPESAAVYNFAVE